MQSLEKAVARLFLVGARETVVDEPLKLMLDAGISAVALFARNIESPPQVAELCSQIKRCAGRPILIAVDQEGGRVARLGPPFSIIPPMRQIGRTGDANLARRIGRTLGRELRAVNIDMDFAPVLDVDTNPNNPVIGDRSFGASPNLVSRMGSALIEGLQAEGVAACGKHFPGHGDTSQDSHHHLPRLPHAMDRLNSVELPPFESAIKAGVASIMTSHVIFEPLDEKYPATMSRPALDGILRDRMKFDGVVISDDLDMKAIAEHFSLEEVLIRGINAGIDLFAICNNFESPARAIQILMRAVRDDRVPMHRIAQAGRRVDALLHRFAKPPTEFDASAIGQTKLDI